MTPEREAFEARLERDGPEAVRIKLSRQTDVPYYTHPRFEWAAEWLAKKDAQRLAVSDALQVSQADAASRAAAAAERAADEAARANKHANTANVIAAAAMIAAIVSIVMQLLAQGAE